MVSRAQLSPECMDLLNKVFVINQDQRITVPNIKAHPGSLTGWGACAQLSPECMDLLNKIFVINQDQRITVPNIKAHPWYTKPLLAKYQAAEETLAKRQEHLNAYVSQRQLNSVRPRHLLLRSLGFLISQPESRSASSTPCALEIHCRTHCSSLILQLEH